MKTKGIAPKVYVPLLVGLVVGVILLLAGDTATGESVLLTVLAAAGLGTAAPPGRVVPKKRP